MQDGPRVLVTGFGPFPGAPENPTERLVRELGREEIASLGAAGLRAQVLPTDYRRSWPALRRLCHRFAPDVVVHFGLSRSAKAVTLERIAERRCNPDLPDAAGYAPRSGFVGRAGPDRLNSTLPLEAIAAALTGAGFPVCFSEDAGAYVCNATLYRSLATAPVGRMVGFVHLPPAGEGGFAPDQLYKAALVIVRTACGGWRNSADRPALL